ncbi:MAG: DUF1987 domain-containing protein [Desulfobacterales bacterium]|nr:DUF1987 domain-containing protein [Desulfobacterales bacterium]
MKDIMIAATKNTPEISFESTNRVLTIKGEAYPENAAEFYAPFFAWLDEYLADAGSGSTQVNIELVYFNSSSSRVLLDLFDKLEESARQGHRVVVNWKYHADNDMILEYGEEFAEEVEAIDFQLQEFSD